MNIAELIDDSNAVKADTETGAKIIGIIRKYLETKFKEHFLIESGSTPYRLWIKYHGLPLTVWVESHLSKDSIESFLKVVSLSYDVEPTSTDLLTCKYSLIVRDGPTQVLVDGASFTEDKFAEPWLRRTMDKMMEGGEIVFRP